MEIELAQHLSEKKMLLISIPKPCHENWNEMSPGDKGRFCQVCSKTVIDFTSLSDEEVKNYFLEKREQKTCGRFRNDQLTSTDTLLSRLLQASIPFWKKFLAIVFILFGNLLSSCHNNLGKIQADHIAVGEPQAEYGTFGVTKAEPDTTLSIIATSGIVEESFQPIDITCETGDIEAVFAGNIVPIVIEDSVCEGPPVTEGPCTQLIEPKPGPAEKNFDKHGRPVLKSNGIDSTNR